MKRSAKARLSVSDSLSELRASIAGYARLVLGLVDEDDQESVDAAEAALEPILRYRKRRVVSEPEAEAETEEPVEAPLPEVPVESE